jgi:hypothetical protein
VDRRAAEDGERGVSEQSALSAAAGQVEVVSDMNSQQELNEKFRAYMSERHPEWSDHFVPAGIPDPEENFVSLALFNPRGHEGSMLEAHTEGLRLTVNFGMHHAHFESEPVETAIAACCELIEGIFQERIVSVIIYQGSRPYVSDFCHIEDLPAVEEASRSRREPGWFKRLLNLSREPEDAGKQTTWRSYGPVHYVLGPPQPGACHLEVRSWLGTHDCRTALS